MKQFNRIIIFIVFVWLLLAVLSPLLFLDDGSGRSKEYLVEVNRLQAFFIRQQTFSGISAEDYDYIRQADYLPVSQGEGEPTTDWTNDWNNFLTGKEVVSYGIGAVPSKYSFYVLPFFLESGLKGYIRYSYTAGNGNTVWKPILLTEAVLGVAILFMAGLLFYIRKTVLKPFHEISELPYELSKGHLSKEIKEESKNRYFGRFLWGLDLLRENLKEHRKKEFQLERDKKLMILSISHDIKTPLSTIKLYSKALYEDLYASEQKRHETARKIEEKADQIEGFVAEIIKTSTTDLFEFDVFAGEFYLKNLVDAIKRSYEEKLELLKIEFTVQSYSDKLLSGDFDKLADIFDNVIQNAIKYGDGRRIAIAFEEEDNCQLIRVMNTGVPVAAVNLHHMFESFWRGENAIGKPGNGLGLYICRQLIRKMDGEIFAEAQEDGMSLVIVLKKG
jgi:signal transduction histidine kinase